MEKKTEVMASPNVARAVLKLAGPAIISLVVLAIYNMADTYFVSLASETDLEVAAVSVYMPILLVTMAVSVLFASGGGALLSRQLGEGDLKGAGETASSTVVLAFISGLIVCACIPWAQPLLLAVGASSDTIDMAWQYAVIMFAASPVQLTNMAFNNLLRAEGNAVRSMTGMVTGALLNIALDPVLISAAGMGVMGAAVATAASQVVSFVILGSAYWRGRTVVPIRLRGFHFQRDTVAYILRVGLSTFLIQIFTGIGFAVVNIYAKPYGDGTIAAIGIVNRLQYLGFAVVFGFAQGYQPVCGFNFGAGRYDLLRRTLYFGFAAAVAIGAALTGFFRLTGRWLIEQFASQAAVIETGVETLGWFTVAYPLTAFTLIIMMTCQSLGQAAEAILVACGRQGFCMIPLLMILSQTLGFQGILISPLLSDIASGLISLYLAVRIFHVLRRRQTA
ncbi:MAG: MATE family efflux transporter [Clostridia bacterium]|nr:MATE family efflux transporter [Clostridia bacterium]